MNVEEFEDVTPRNGIPSPLNKQALLVLLVSVGLATIAPQLLVLSKLSLGFAVFIVVILSIVVGLKLRFKQAFAKESLALFCLISMLSLMLALRSTSTLYVCSLLGIFIAAFLLFTTRYAQNFYSVKISVWLITPFLLLHSVLISPLILLRLANIHAFFSLDVTAQLRSISLGLIWAVPLLFLFGALLTSADSRFDDFIHRLFAWNFEESIESLVKPILYFPIMATMLLSIVNKERKELPVFGQNIRMSGIQINVVLCCLNTLFFTYLAVQVSYFFGGDQLVITTQGLTYATYAKSGFWELVCVAIIALPLLLLGHWLQRDEVDNVKQWFTRLSSLLILAIIVLELSAAHRMALYIQAYGLTQLRFYSSAFMVYIIVCLFGFYFTVLKNKREAYVFILSVTAIGIILGLNVINPSALIAQYNLGQPASSKIDTRYLIGLGADAYPAIVEFKKHHPEKMDCQLKQLMINSLVPAKSWVHWNYSQQKALNALNAWGPDDKCLMKSATARGPEVSGF